MVQPSVAVEDVDRDHGRGTWWPGSARYIRAATFCDDPNRPPPFTNRPNTHITRTTARSGLSTPTRLHGCRCTRYRDVDHLWGQLPRAISSRSAGVARPYSSLRLSATSRACCAPDQ